MARSQRNARSARARTIDPHKIDLAPPSAHHESDRRRLAELVVHRSEFLLPQDRALVTTVYRDGLRASDAARLLGPPRTPDSVRRRLRTLISRMLSPGFETVLRSGKQWPPPRRRIAEACVLEGRTRRDAAEHLGLTLHRVRTEMAVINALVNDNAEQSARSGAA